MLDNLKTSIPKWLQLNKGVLLFSFLLLVSGCASGPLFESTAENNQASRETQKNWSAEALDAFNKGVGYLENDKEASRIAFSNAIELAPSMEAAYFNLAKLEFNDGNFDAADNISNLAQQNKVVSARLFNLSATVKRQQLEFEDAKELYLKALQLNKNYTPALLNIAILYDVYLGDIEAAEKYYVDYQKALSVQGKEDNRLKNWLTDLRRRIQKQTGATQ